MILTGKQILTQRLIRNLLNPTLQQQPCGVDLTLRQVSIWTTAGSVDFDNTHRVAAKTRVLPLYPSRDPSTGLEKITLKPGAYLVDFNEGIKVPLGCMARIYPRSSLWRAGVSVQAGVIDAGYEGCLGALLDVRNPAGVVLFRGARLAQVVVEEMGEEVGGEEGYRGVYQGRGSVGGGE